MNFADKPGVCLVTGASGFIASHVVRLLLEKGHKVRGTVRSIRNSSKVQPLRQLYPDKQQNLELVEAELLDASSWKKAVEGCSYVFHVASPFPSKEPKSPEELFKPAVDGTLNVLNAAKDIPSVKRVVLTSSLVAMLGVGGPKPSDENDWTSMDSKCSSYVKSKVLAEKAAWDFMKEKKPSFELVAVNPGFVSGPLLQSEVCTSAELVARLLNTPWKCPMLPLVCFPMVDVRDVAMAHYQAMFVPEAAGSRFGIANQTRFFHEIAGVLRDEFGPQGYFVPTAVAPYWAVWLFSFFDKSAAMTLDEIGRNYQLDNTKMRTVLGVELTDFRKSILDMAYSLIERGLVKKTAKYKGQSDSS